MADIPVSQNDRRKSYVATAGQTVFAYDFPVYDEDHLKVTRKVAATGVESVLTLTTDYTVSGVEEVGGGNVTLVSGAALNDVIVVEGNTPIERLTDYQQGGGIRSAVLNEELDLITFMVQEIRRAYDRTARLLASVADNVSAVLPAPVANRALKWSSDGLSIVNSTYDPDAQVADATAQANAAAASATAAASAATSASGSASAATTKAGEAAASATAAAASAATAQATVGGVQVTTNDTTAAPLQSKLLAGTAISLTLGNSGGNETLTVACTLDPEDQTARDIAVSAYIKADVAGNDGAGVYGRVFSDDFETDTIGANSTNETYSATGFYYYNIAFGAAISSPNPGAATDVSGTTSIIVDDVVLTNSTTFGKFGYYSTIAGAVTIKIAKENSSTSYDIVAEVTFAHPGGGWADTSYTYTVPATGTYKLGAWRSAVAHDDTTIKAAHRYSGNATGNAVAFTNNPADWAPSLRAYPVAAPPNMTLVSNAHAMASEPTDVSLYVLVRDVDTVVNGTDRKIYASIDNGSTWTEAATYTVVGTWGATDKLIRADVNVSAQTGTSVKWKAETLNNKEQQVKQVTGFAA